MTATEWKKALGPNTEIGVCGSLYHDLAACEAERDKAKARYEELKSTTLATIQDLREAMAGIQHLAFDLGLSYGARMEVDRDDLRRKLDEVKFYDALLAKLGRKP